MIIHVRISFIHFLVNKFSNEDLIYRHDEKDLSDIFISFKFHNKIKTFIDNIAGGES